MLKTEQELQEFLRKEPNKGQVTKELQELSKEIEKLNTVAVYYGKDNQSLSNEVNKKNHCWTHHSNYNNRDKAIFYNNKKKKQQILNQITNLNSIKKELQAYVPKEYVQMKLDFNKLDEVLNKALS